MFERVPRQDRHNCANEDKGVRQQSHLEDVANSQVLSNILPVSSIVCELLITRQNKN